MLFSLFYSGLYPAISMVVAIMLCCIAVARQEIAIEGPFGWSALTLTKRFATNTRTSKIYRGFTGQDKWATSYHLSSNLVWLMVFLFGIFQLPMYNWLTEVHSWKAVICFFVLGFCCFLTTTWVEDHIWFLLHPYYGQERHNKEYVPWFQSFYKGIPATYFSAIAGTIFLTVVTSLAFREPRIIITWAEVFILTTIVTFVGVQQWSKRISRKPLAKYWWNNCKVIVIKRCPYPVEAKDPQQEVVAYTLTQETLEELIQSGEAIPLDKALSG